MTLSKSGYRIFKSKDGTIKTPEPTLRGKNKKSTNH